MKTELRADMGKWEEVGGEEKAEVPAQGPTRPRVPAWMAKLSRAISVVMVLGMLVYTIYTSIEISKVVHLFPYPDIPGLLDYDLAFMTFAWAPFGVIVLANVILDLYGPYGRLRALDVRPGVKYSWPRRVFHWFMRSRLRFGPPWFFKSWSFGDVALILILVLANFAWMSAEPLQTYVETGERLLGNPGALHGLESHAESTQRILTRSASATTVNRPERQDRGGSTPSQHESADRKALPSDVHQSSDYYYDYGYDTEESFLENYGYVPPDPYFATNVEYCNKEKRSYEGNPRLLILGGSLANRAGIAGSWDIGACFVFAVRENHALKAVVGSEMGQYSHGLRYHILTSYLAFIMLSFHSWWYLGFALYEYGNLRCNVNWITGEGEIYAVGLVAYLLLVVMVLCSFHFVRRRSYVLFYWSHQLYIPFVFFSMAHFLLVRYSILGGLLYFVYDRMVVWLDMYRWNRALLTALDDELIRVDVNLTKSLREQYAPGDWVRIKFFGLGYGGWINWHPYSIASYGNAQPDSFTLFIKAKGRWSKKLHAYANGRNGERFCHICVQGPFGSRARSYLRSDRLVAVGGGTGICAVLPHVEHFARCNPERPISVFWVTKRLRDLGSYPEYLTACGKLHAQGRLRLRVYITRSSAEEIEQELRELYSDSEPSFQKLKLAVRDANGADDAHPDLPVRVVSDLSAEGECLTPAGFAIESDGADLRRADAAEETFATEQPSEDRNNPCGAPVAAAANGGPVQSDHLLELTEEASEGDGASRQGGSPPQGELEARMQSGASLDLVSTRSFGSGEQPGKWKAEPEENLDGAEEVRERPRDPLRWRRFALWLISLLMVFVVFGGGIGGYVLAGKLMFRGPRTKDICGADYAPMYRGWWHYRCFYAEEVNILLVFVGIVVAGFGLFALATLIDRPRKDRLIHSRPYLKHVKPRADFEYVAGRPVWAKVQDELAQAANWDVPTTMLLAGPEVMTREVERTFTRKAGMEVLTESWEP